MNKKIVLVNGSPRKKTTFHYLLQLEKLFQQNGLDTEIIHLKDKNINQCSGCEVCITKGICIQKDDMKNLRNIIKSADGMVLSSPVYLRSISGLLKNFIDRTCDYYHRTELAAKPVLSLVTTAASGVKETQGYLKDVIIQWGSVPSGKISRSLKNSNKEITEKEIEKFIYYINNGTKSYAPSLKEVLGFQVQKILASKVIQLDKLYWQEKNWLDSYYFFPCKVSVGKKLLAKTLFKILDKKIKPVEKY